MDQQLRATVKYYQMFQLSAFAPNQYVIPVSYTHLTLPTNREV